MQTTRAPLPPLFHTLSAALLATVVTACGGNITESGVDGGAGEDAPSICTDHDQCTGGLCLDGTCCPAGNVCNDSCCADSETCFANRCVTVGDICYSQSDCADDEYCETGLGPGGDTPPPEADAGVDECMHPLPPEGRCVELPPPCDEQDPTQDDFCIPECEYRPPEGALNARMQWRWGPVADQYANFTDVWSTPTVGRLFDSNCDGHVNELDPPQVIFVSGNARGTCCSCGGYTPSTCHTGVLRMLDGETGQEIWSLRKASADSVGFMGLSVAIGDIDGDARPEIAAVTGEGYVVLVNAEGAVFRTSDHPIAGSGAGGFGWGGGLAIADMDHDGFPEIAYGKAVFTTAGGGLTRLFDGGATGTRALSIVANLDDDDDLELLAGNIAYKIDGSVLWSDTSLPVTYPATGDFDLDGVHEVVLTGNGKVWILDAATGEILLGPTTLPGTGAGGPPTVADFDGDGLPEIGVAQAQYYSMLKPNLAEGTLDVLWQAPNHDLSSSVTGSTVFDFEGDGKAEVVYNDECFLWVYDGATGAVRFATPTTSFTATEASVVADVDGDGHAEMLMISNGADPSASGWKCDISPWNQPDPENNRPAWEPPAGGTAYRGITLWADAANSWVGTRTLWNQHSYHVTNICDDTDDACGAPNSYAAIPQFETLNCSVDWLNNYRQNVQGDGIWDAPDATVDLKADCEEPIILHAYVRNLGAAQLPAGVEVGFFVVRDGEETLLGTATTPNSLFPGQVAEIEYLAQPGDDIGLDDLYRARILVDPAAPSFHECREDNNASIDTRPICIG